MSTTRLPFADPAMSLKATIPKKPLNLKVEDEPGEEGGVMLTWDEAFDYLSIPFIKLF
ncbi:MAG: hypothetical protein ACMUJM_14010 [bacterium]